MNIAADVVVQRGIPVYLTVHPYVSSVSEAQTLSGSTSATIWATSIPPDINLATAGIPITDLPTIELTDPDEDDIFN